MKKESKIKAFVILLGLLLTASFEASAGVLEKFENNIGSKNLSEIYISIAIVGGSLLVYFVGKLFIKEKVGLKRHNMHFKHSANRHHRHIIKKTA